MKCRLGYEANAAVDFVARLELTECYRKEGWIRVRSSPTQPKVVSECKGMKDF